MGIDTLVELLVDSHTRSEKSATDTSSATSQIEASEYIFNQSELILEIVAPLRVLSGASRWGAAQNQVTAPSLAG
jgi:hypothetical protein